MQIRHPHFAAPRCMRPRWQLLARCHLLVGELGRRVISRRALAHGSWCHRESDANVFRLKTSESKWYGVLVAVLWVIVPGWTARAVEQVTFRQDGTTHSVGARILLEAMDGGLMLQAPDGSIWTLESDEVLSRESNDKPFKSLDVDELVAQVRQELPPGFSVHRTAHYLVFFNTSRAYAQWCGSLFERLHRAFHNFWRRRGMSLQPSETPLVAILFDDAAQYRDYSRPDLGAGTAGVIGYYSLKTNRITTYDLTGIEAVRTAAPRTKTSVVINQILAQPSAAPSVATLVHEAVHQLAFNSGLQKRYADNPLWISEGLAVYFEVPDLSSSKGWRGIGAVHPTRLDRFRQTQNRRGRRWVEELIVSDDRFRDRTEAVTAYAEAWTLCHFLASRRETALVEYLKDLGQGQLLEFLGPDERYATFVKHFGDCQQLQRDLDAYVSAL